MMDRAALRLTAFALVALLAAPVVVAHSGANAAGPVSAPVATAPATAVPGAAPPALQFRCATGQPGPQDLLVDPEEERVVLGCPIRIYDTTRRAPTEGSMLGYHFGNAQLAVSPGDERQAAFVSLHGDPAPDGSGMTSRSRIDLTHTTFTTDDQGITWTDQPHRANGAGPDGLAYHGESAALAMDSEGNMYIAFLWSLPNGDPETGYGSRFSLYKANAPEEPNTATQAYAAGKTFSGRSAYNPIARVGLVYVATPTPPAPLGNATPEAPPPSDPGEQGELADPNASASALDRVVAVWHERAGGNRSSPNAYSAWIDATVTDTTANNQWTRLADDQLIGPCRDASNPVPWNGLVYVACQVERGYDHRRGARIGDNDIWSIDPITGNTTLVAATGIPGGHPILAATPDGYFALVTTTLDGELGARVETGYGWYGRGWAARGDIGAELHRMAGSLATHDAVVTGLAISPREKTVAITYMEWQKSDGPVPPQPAPALPDPANPQPPMPRLTDYKKLMVSFNECAFPLAASAMQLGTGIDAQNFEAYRQQPSMFDDFQDGLVAYTDASGADLFYFAINDYGAMQFGAFVASPASAYCPLTPPLAAAPPPALPQVLTLTSPATLVVGAVVGLTSVAMVTYILAVKRKSASATVAEDK